MKNDNALFYACGLIEYIGRVTQNTREAVVDYLGDDISRIYRYADVFHCEPIEKVADDFIIRNDIPTSTYDVTEKARYSIPDYWDIGEVFARLVEDNYTSDDVVRGIREVMSSWIAERILNFNSDLYYQSREYLSACYQEGEILVA